MSERDDNREWLTGTGRYEGRSIGEWAQNLVDRFGLEGALDWLAATGSDVWSIDLRRSPWAGRPWLRDLVREARAAHGNLSRALYALEHDPDHQPADVSPVEAHGRFAVILHEIRLEAARSIEKHGEQTHLPMGTGPDTTPLDARPVLPEWAHAPGLWPGMSARQLARIATLDTKSHSANEGGDDTCTWWLILREEVLEAAAEDDPADLRAELIQVAAVALKMIDAIDTTQQQRSPVQADRNER